MTANLLYVVLLKFFLREYELKAAKLKSVDFPRGNPGNFFWLPEIPRPRGEINQPRTAIPNP